MNDLAGIGGPTFDELDALIQRRRTNKLVEADREVPPAVIENLCRLVTWAPNHKRTWPWRFASLTGDARARLGEAFVVDMIARDFGDEGKRVKTLTKYTRTPNVLVIGSASDASPTLASENRDAVAAGIQNLLLGATTLDIATFWSTPPLNDSEAALELCGFEPDVTIVGVIYLGWQTATPDAPVRPPASIRFID